MKNVRKINKLHKCIEIFGRMEYSIRIPVTDHPWNIRVTTGSMWLGSENIVSHCWSTRITWRPSISPTERSARSLSAGYSLL